MSTIFSRALVVMRSLSFRTHAFTLCVITGTLLLCLGLFKEPNTDYSHTTTNVKKEMETASASNLTITMEVVSLSMNASVTQDVLEVGQLTADESIMTDETLDVSIDEYFEFARLVEAEAKSEDLNGKTLVASVVMNRIASDIFPNYITEVINDPGQFDPVSSHYIDYVEPSHDAKQAVMTAINGPVRESLGALYFQKSAAEEWGNKTYLFRYGSHSFYK